MSGEMNNLYIALRDMIYHQGLSDEEILAHFPDSPESVKGYLLEEIQFLRRNLNDEGELSET